jgi:hypothetical protein
MAHLIHLIFAAEGALLAEERFREIRELFVFWSFFLLPLPLPSPLGGGLVRKLIVMWWPEG